MIRPMLAAMFCCSAVCAQSVQVHRDPPADAATPYTESLSNYERRTLLGFDLYIHNDLIEQQPALLARVLLQLEHDLDMIDAALADPQMDILRRSPVWIELQGAIVPGGMSGRGMCFHPSADWLTSHGLLAEKQNGIEIIRAADFPSWRKNQPWMTFHEFAHAYHLHLSHSNKDIAEAYQAAKDAGLYEAVAYNASPDGKPKRAYALNNPIEYFAELSEAYFGLNNFYPFTRSQLKSHDPAGFALVERLWALSADELAQYEASP